MNTNFKIYPPRNSIGLDIYLFFEKFIDVLISPYIMNLIFNNSLIFIKKIKTIGHLCLVWDDRFSTVSGPLSNKKIASISKSFFEMNDRMVSGSMYKKKRLTGAHACASSYFSYLSKIRAINELIERDAVINSWLTKMTLRKVSSAILSHLEDEYKFLRVERIS